MFCNKCGQENLQDAKFCQKCGAEQSITPVVYKPNKNLFGYYFDVLKKYAVFSGRSSRREYWSFILISQIMYFLIVFIESLLGINPEDNESVFGNIYQLAVFIPTIAVGVRRMHDVGKRGWYILIPIYNFLLTIRQGTSGYNKHGSDPRIVN